MEELKKALKLLVFLVFVWVRIGLCLNVRGDTFGIKNDFMHIQFSRILRKLALMIQFIVTTGWQLIFKAKGKIPIF